MDVPTDAETRRAMADGLFRWLSTFRTAALPLATWAVLFGRSRNGLAEFMANYPGATCEGGRWRLRLVDAPPAYFAHDSAAMDHVLGKAMHRIALICTETGDEPEMLSIVALEHITSREEER